MGIAIELIPAALAVDPGRLARMEVHLTNDGPDACEVAVELPEGGRDWSWVHPESCSVGPAATGVATVFFKPAQGAHPPAGRHTVVVVARNAGGPGVDARAEATVEVGPFVDAAGHLHPMVAYDPVAHDYTFSLENQGNVPITATLDTDDPSGELKVDVAPRALHAAPGEAASAVVSVQARRKLKKGEHTYRVCVLATVEGGSELRVEGAFRQQGAKARK